MRNAEQLSLNPFSPRYVLAGNGLRKHYLHTIKAIAIQSQHEKTFQKMFRVSHRSHMKRQYSTESLEDIQPSKKARKGWQAPLQESIAERPERWDQYHNKLTLDLRNHTGDGSRAAHLLRMVYAIASKAVINTWESSANITPSNSQNTTNASVFITIYNIISRGRSRTFYDNVLLRVGKYLLARRISTQVEELRESGSPSKQRIGEAGIHGEGNAVTRAFDAFVQQLKNETDQNIDKRDLQKWWTEGKTWMLLANAIDPAVLLFIPCGHKSWDDHRIWESE